MRQVAAVTLALCLVAGGAAAGSRSTADTPQLAQVTYSFCTNHDGNSYIVPSGEQRQFRSCNNFFYSLSSAIGMACFSYLEGISNWPQVSAPYFGISFSCP
jgi:hypothetical protein